MMDMELENIVANTVYIKAREGGGNKRKGKSKKWKDMLRFPTVVQCEKVLSGIEKNYPSIVEKQPIGHRLFYDFCKTSEYRSCVEFLDLVQEYDLSIEDKRKIAQKIREEFLTPPETHRLTVRINNQ